MSYFTGHLRARARSSPRSAAACCSRAAFASPAAISLPWSVALLGLLISLGSQALGHLAGFDSAMFRAMELGGQVIAPLALVLALSEVGRQERAGEVLRTPVHPGTGHRGRRRPGPGPAGADQLHEGVAGSGGVLRDAAQLCAHVRDRAGDRPRRVARRLVGSSPVRPARLECAACASADGRRCRRCCLPIPR